MPNPIDSLPPDEQELLRRHRARAARVSPATPAPLTIDPILHAEFSQVSDCDEPETPVTRSFLPFGAPLTLRRPVGKSIGTPSTVTTPSVPGALPTAPASIPMEKPAQRRAIKRQRNILESGTEDSGAESLYGRGASKAPHRSRSSTFAHLKDPSRSRSEATAEVHRGRS